MGWIGTVGVTLGGAVALRRLVLDRRAAELGDADETNESEAAMSSNSQPIVEVENCDVSVISTEEAVSADAGPELLADEALDHTRINDGSAAGVATTHVVADDIDHEAIGQDDVSEPCDDEAQQTTDLGEPASDAEPITTLDEPPPIPEDEVSVPADEDEPVDESVVSVVRTVIEWVAVLIVALVVAVLLRTFVLGHYEVVGQSMSTTMESGDRVLVSKLSYRLHDPGRGDVVVLHQESDYGQSDLIKRVIALPGETIEMTDCVVTIDGAVLEEPYLDADLVATGNCGAPIDPLVVPEGEVFVMGDNRPYSRDSRALGPIQFDHLIGRAFVVFWPFSDFHGL